MAEYLMSELQVPGVGDPVMIIKDKEARQDLSTALATVTGNPLNFSTRSAQKTNKTVISLEPIQDLHGYDHPWPAGGGKNILPMIIDEIKAVNTKGTWNGNVYTYNGITYTFIFDADGNILGINASGTTAGSASFFGVKFDIADNISIVGNGCPNGGSVSTDSYRMDVRQNTVDGLGYDNAIDGGSGTKTFTTGGNTLYFSIRIAANYELPTGGLIFKPMIRLASESNTFAPYSNYCPIDGRTETSLVGCGKNIWGGERLADDIVAKVTGAVKDTTNKTITFSAENVDGKKLFTNPDENKRYTVILYGHNTNNNSKATNISFKYSDGSIRKIEFQLSGSNSYAIAYSEEGKTLKGLFGYWGSMNTILYYDQCGVFEGILTADDFVPYVESNNLTIQFGEKVYGGTVDLESGTVTVDKAIVNVPHAATDWTKSSNGSIPSGRHGYYGSSDMFPGCRYSGGDDNPNHVEMLFNQAESGYSAVDVITSTTFKIGIGKTGLFTSIWCNTDFATKEEWLTYLTNNPLQVCYPLATPRTIQLTPNEISLLKGVNNISTDGDSISLTYRDGKVATLGDLEDTANNLQEQIDQNETMEDETTQLLYKLGVNNGLLYIEEV